MHLPMTTISNMQVALFPAASTAVYEREVISRVKLRGLISSPGPSNDSVTLSELSDTVGLVQEAVAKF